MRTAQTPKKFGTVTHKDGTVQILRRRLPSGRSIPVGQTGRTWQALVAPGPKVTGGRALDADHPSRKHHIPQPLAVVTPSADVPSPVPGQPRRRDRRAAERAAKKASGS